MDISIPYLVEVGSIGKVGLGGVIFLLLGLALYLFLFAMDGSVCFRIFFNKKEKLKGPCMKLKIKK